MQIEDGNRRLEKAFLLCRSRLLALAFGIVRHRDLAEEAVQEAFLKVMQFGEQNEVRDPTGYCCQVVRNLSLDLYRRSSLEAAYRTHLRDDEELQDVDTRVEITPDRIVHARRVVEMLDAALLELPMRTRRAFALSRNGGMTQREIGKVLGCSATTVNFMIRDADVALERFRDSW
jgi:RNA polymerase sigma factor (sigma-70 family)